MAITFFEESDRVLMRRSFTYQRAMLGYALRVFFYTVLGSFSAEYKKLIPAIVAEREATEKAPERLFGWDK